MQTKTIAQTLKEVAAEARREGADPVNRVYDYLHKKDPDITRNYVSGLLRFFGSQEQGLERERDA